MATTLKFGGGKWGVKKGSTLAYNDEGNNYKPLPFTFTRSTSATRVNKDGLIEVVTNNKPRIDFLNDSNGALLLEPSRTNYVTYSEDFSDSSWFFDDATLISNSVVSPDGTQNASTLIGSTVNSRHNIGASIGNASVDGSYTIFAKAKELRYLQITSANTVHQYVNFDLLNGVFVLGSDFSNAKMEDYGNGWYKCTVVSDDEYNGYYLSLVSGLNATWLESWVMPNNTDGLYIWGAQLEQGSYATSYIPTQGAIATRVAETCSQTPPSGIIGQTEGTLYWEVDFGINDTSEYPAIFLWDGSSNNRILIQRRGNSSTLQCQITVGGVVQFNQIGNTVVGSGVVKIAVAYKENDFAVYLNGSQELIDQIGITYSGAINQFSFANTRHDKTNQIKLYNTRLSNAELQQLTTL